MIGSSADNFPSSTVPAGTRKNGAFDFLYHLLCFGPPATLWISAVSKNLSIVAAKTDLFCVMCVHILGQSKRPICRNPSVIVGNGNRCTSLLPTCSKSAREDTELLREQCGHYDTQVQRNVLIELGTFANQLIANVLLHVSADPRKSRLACFTEGDHARKPAACTSCQLF